MDSISLKIGERASHAYIAASPSVDERTRSSRALATALVCSSKAERPCGICRDCRKALAGVHPDIINIAPGTDAEGKRKRGISVDQVREVVADAQVMPNEAERKVYIFDDADSMNASAQNALLKLLEEPPASAAFVLCVPGEAALLPTIRSRCVTLRINADATEDEEARENASAMLRAINAGTRRALLDWQSSVSDMNTLSALAMFRSARVMLADELTHRGPIGLSAERCMDLDALFSRCTTYLKVNTGVKHVIGTVVVHADTALK